MLYVSSRAASNINVIATLRRGRDSPRRPTYCKTLYPRIPCTVPRLSPSARASPERRDVSSAPFVDSSTLVRIGERNSDVSYWPSPGVGILLFACHYQPH